MPSGSKKRLKSKKKIDYVPPPELTETPNQREEAKSVDAATSESVDSSPAKSETENKAVEQTTEFLEPAVPPKNDEPKPPTDASSATDTSVASKTDAPNPPAVEKSVNSDSTKPAVTEPSSSSVETSEVVEPIPVDEATSVVITEPGAKVASEISSTPQEIPLEDKSIEHGKNANEVKEVATVADVDTLNAPPGSTESQTSVLTGNGSTEDAPKEIIAAVTASEPQETMLESSVAPAGETKDEEQEGANDSKSNKDAIEEATESGKITLETLEQESSTRLDDESTSKEETRLEKTEVSAVISPPAKPQKPPSNQVQPYKEPIPIDGCLGTVSWMMGWKFN